MQWSSWKTAVSAMKPDPSLNAIELSLSMESSSFEILIVIATKLRQLMLKSYRIPRTLYQMMPSGIMLRPRRSRKIIVLDVSPKPSFLVLNRFLCRR